MDFFEAQARAKKRTTRLVVLFALAVGGTIMAGYLAAVIVIAQAGGGFEPWQPSVFTIVAFSTLAVIGVASLVKWGQFSRGGGAVAESVGGRRISAATTDPAEKRLVNVVEEMAIASGTPVPAVYVMDDEPSINAFAAGLTTSDAAVAVTRGTLQKLTRDELQGVIGHEFSHILNGDMRLNVRLSALLFGILVIGLAGRGVLSGMGRGRVRTSRNNKGGGGLALVLVIGLALMIVGYVGYFFGRIIQAAVSRQREFLADASAVQFTRNPLGLSNALRKIGGLALGSSIQTSKGAAIGHFFFAQAFQSALGSVWATHPPLDDRIRAIDPSFDGKYIEPPEVVDVAREPWARPGRPADLAGFAPGALARSQFQPAPEPQPSIPPRVLVSAAGALSPELVAHAHNLLETLPPGLREAAHSPAGAQALLCGLLLSDDPAIRSAQQTAVVRRDGAVAERLAALERELAGLGPESKLPLLQIAVPALREVPPHDLGPYFDILDDLVHADARVTAFEFALQKIVLRTLQVGRNPAGAVTQFHSFYPLVDDIAVVLSALANSDEANPSAAVDEFARGAAQLPLVRNQLRLLQPAAADFAALDRALDRLAASSPPIKERVLAAAAEVIATDGVVRIEEAELLRAIAATLDVPLPPSL